MQIQEVCVTMLSLRCLEMPSPMHEPKGEIRTGRVNLVSHHPQVALKATKLDEISKVERGKEDSLLRLGSLVEEGELAKETGKKPSMS